MYRPKAGDVFCLPLTPSQWLSGRVLLDVARQCIASHRLPAGSSLTSFPQALLVELHGMPTTEPRPANERILVPSVFIALAGFVSGSWIVVGDSALDPTEVSFPAALLGGGPKVNLKWGEITLPTNVTYPEFVNGGIMHTTHKSVDIPAKCLVELGRADELDSSRYRNPDALRFSNNDLRLSEKGRAIMTGAGLPPNPRYYDEAAARGIDTKRFYEPDPRIPFDVCLQCYARRTPPQICWACGVDTNLDALLETSEAELATMPRKTCPSCGTMIPKLALRCATCPQSNRRAGARSRRVSTQGR